MTNNITDTNKEEKKIRSKKLYEVVTPNPHGMLNVRSKPSLDSEVLLKLKNGHVVEVQPNFKNSEFFKIKLEDASYGYCMKDFLIESKK